MALTRHDQLATWLELCLAQAEEAQKLAKKGIKTIRQHLKAKETPDYLKRHYRKQLRKLRFIVKSTETEVANLRALILRVRWDALTYQTKTQTT
jgi:hypothetical protein